MTKLVKKLSLKQGDTSEEFYFDATTGVKGYEYYSTDEVVIGKWVDGKPIYRKTLYIPSLPNATTVKYTLGSDEIDATIRCDGWTDNTAGTNRFNIPYYNVSNSSYTVWLYHTAPNTISVTTGANRSSQFAYITCEYTKKKDSSDSFVEEKVELTAEHKTGETFNGKDVYEKIEESTNIQLGKWYAPTGITTPNVETVIEISGYWDSGENGSVEPLAARVDASMYGSSVEYHQGTHSMTGQFAVYLGTGLGSVKKLRLKAKYTKKA